MKIQIENQKEQLILQTLEAITDLVTNRGHSDFLFNQMSIYTDEFWDAQAAKLTGTSQILKLPWEEKRGKDLGLKKPDWTALDDDYAEDCNYVPEGYDLKVEKAVLV